MEGEYSDKKFLDKKGLQQVFGLLKGLYYTKKEVDEKIPEGGNTGGGESCKCPQRWTYLGQVEFEFSYTTTDNQKLDLPESNSVILHEWDAESNKGKIQFNANGVPKMFFYLQDTLKTIEINTPCPKIGNEAFRGCTSLEQITLPNTIVKLGERSFQNCQPLDNVVIPEGVTEIPEACFIGCHITTTGPNGSKLYSDGLITITLPDSLEVIGKEAFEDCTGLTELKMPKNVKRIASRAFQQCEKLTFTDWDFFRDIEEIEEKAFQSCHYLNFPNNVLEIPRKMTEVKSEVFSYSYCVKEIKLHDNVEKLAAKAFYTTGFRTLNTNEDQPFYIDKINIPASVKFIGKQCFASDRRMDGYKDGTQGHVTIKTIDVEDINKYVSIEFEDRNSHPNSMQNYKNSGGGITANRCTLLINGEEVKDIEITANISELDQDMFHAIGNIDSVTLPETLTKIETRAFAYSGVKKVDASKCRNLSFIGNDAFSGTTNLSLDFSNCALDELEERALSGATLTSINLSNTNLKTLPKGMNAVEIDLTGSAIEVIPDKALANSKLTTLNLSNCSSLTSIGTQAVASASTLTNLTLTGCTNLETIGEQAFGSCGELSEVDLSDLTALTTIGRKAFEKCLKLKTVNLAGCTNLTTIGEQAFYGGSSSVSEVEEIDLSVCPNLTTLGNKVFPHVVKLTVNDTAPYLGEMERWTSNASSPTPTSNKVLKEVIIKGTSKVAEGLYLSTPTYYVDETMLEQYTTTYPTLNFSKID